MKITVHIGSTKTGSSALQAHLFKAREDLVAKGIWYSNSGVKSNAHHVLFASVHPGAWEMHKDELSGDIDERFAYFKDTLSRIISEAESAGIEHIVLSSEYWWTILPPQFRNIISLAFKEHDVRLVACIRRQDRWLEATYLQSVKSGEKRPFDEWLKARLSNPHFGGSHYLRILNYWTETLLPVETVVVPYEFTDRSEYIKRISSKVCDEDVGDIVVPTTAMVVNKSPNKEGCNALLQVNQRQQASPDRGAELIEIMKNNSRPENTKDATLLNIAEQQRLLLRFYKINDLVVKMYCPEISGSLFDMSEFSESEKIVASSAGHG